MDNDEKNIHMTSGGLSSETLSEDEQRPYEEKIEIPLDDSETKYDDFMFEPLGFEELEKQSELEKSRVVQQNALKFKRQKRIVVLLVLIFLSILALCIYCIVSDIISSKKSAGNLNTGKSVVLYQSHKPDTANPEYVDENGKYSTEGIAIAVRPSIVEIYAYEDSAHTTLKGTGSGIIISEDGYIVTNEHVLSADGYHTVKTHDEKIYNAEIVGRDSKTDIAVVKINASGLKPATLGDSDEVVVGEEVMAIGNPAGLFGSVTNGIVSAVNRKIRGKTTSFEMDCIQTNADISPGNSGGALINMYAQVIGITSSKYASTTLEGLGFAISINEAKPVIEELINNGYISGRFKIGITFIGISNDELRATVEEELGYSLPEDFEGLYVTDINEECDIADSGLKKGDFIYEVEGKSVNDYDSLYNIIKNFSAGDTVHAKCASISKDGEITKYDISFKLMEDTSGDY